MKISKCTASLSCTAILALIPVLTLACSKKPNVAAPEPDREVGRMYIGRWEGKDNKGDIYTIRFTGSEWECLVEEGGASRPYYRGAYTYEGALLNLLIKEEADLNTMGWRPQRGNLGPSITGRLEGRNLKITALTDATLLKK